MSEPPATRFEHMQRRYRERDLPWDQPLPPPEIMDLAAQLSPGRALDLGCGPGRASIYLAAAGWEVDAVDFVAEAIAMAAERVQAAHVADRVHLHHAPVTELGFLPEPYDLVVDVGCMHGLEHDAPVTYAAQVARLARPDAHFVLFAHLWAGGDDSAPASIPETTITTLFQDAFRIEQAVYGTTQVGERRWRSAWLYFRRRAAGDRPATG